MGIDAHNLALLAHAADRGASFARTLGVGRQAVFVDPPELARFRAWRALPPLDGAAALAQESGAPRYFEPLMRQWFGATAVDSVDASPYEAATLIHDMNRPWQQPFAEADRYDAVLDFGCLEHVFDFPTAWRNCVDACRTGGFVLHAVPANNLCGHGFYQFSPELFYNLYREANGFALQGVWLATKADLGHWWAVADPAALHRRVTLANASETYLLVMAKKLRPVEQVAPPQQSDYAQGEWQRLDSGAPRAAPASRGRLGRMLASLGLADTARGLRDGWSAMRSTTALPAPDYARIDVAALLSRRAG